MSRYSRIMTIGSMKTNPLLLLIYPSFMAASLSLYTSISGGCSVPPLNTYQIPFHIPHKDAELSNEY